MKKSAMTVNSRKSILDSTQTLKYGGVKPSHHKPELALALPLTSLIDAFSIIVIYLLIGTQSGPFETPTSKDIRLPIAENGTAVDKETPILKIEKGVYFLNNKMVKVTDLGARLVEMSKEQKRKGPKEATGEIMIQADQAMDYAALDPILRAGSEAGIQKLKFAVLPPK